MNKEAGFLKVMINRILRSKHTPLRSYYTNIARKGLDAGFENRTSTMLPITGATALTALGPATGVLEHLVGNQIGQHIRHDFDTASHQLVGKMPHLQSALGGHDPKLQDVINLMTPGTANNLRQISISKNNWRRLRRQVGNQVQHPLIRAVLQANDLPTQQMIDHGKQIMPQATSPLIRHIGGALQLNVPQSPLADRVARATIKPVAPRHQGTALLAEAGIPTAVNLLTGATSPVSAALNMAYPAYEAVLAHKAEQGKVQGLVGMKTRLMSNMANPQPGVLPLAARTAQRAWGWFDPVVDEFTRVGDNLNKIRQTANTEASKLGPNAPAAQAIIRNTADAFSERGSYRNIAKGLSQDFSPELNAVGRTFRAIPSAVASINPTGWAPSTAVTTVQNALAPQRQQGFMDFMSGRKIASARHHLPIINVQRHDGEVKVCPHCHKEVTQGSVYTDAKGWKFHRPCFMKGKGSIDMEKGGNLTLRGLGGAAIGGGIGALAGHPIAGAIAGGVSGLLSDYVVPSVAPAEDDPTAKLPVALRRRLKSKFRTIINALARRGTPTNTDHNRIVVPREYMSPQELSDLGFIESKVAVPEHGQSQFTSWRHPHNLYHFHKHPTAMIVHQDLYPSLDMLRYHKRNPLERLIKDIPQGISHAIGEGVPGYINYIKNRFNDAITSKTPAAQPAEGSTDNQHSGMIKAILQENPHAIIRMRQPKTVSKTADAPVIHEKQINDAACGPAVLKSVENSMGTGHPDQRTYEQETGTTDAGGTPIVNLEQTAANHGLGVDARGKMDINQLQQQTQSGKPVITAVQLDGPEGGPPGGWNAGHYVVVKGVDGNQVRFMDPNANVPERSWPIQEFLNRWHDHDHRGNTFDQWGMALYRPGEAKVAADGALGSGADQSQNTQEMAVMDGSGSVPAGGSDMRPASDEEHECYLDQCEQDPDPSLFDTAALEKVGMSRWRRDDELAALAARLPSEELGTHWYQNMEHTTGSLKDIIGRQLRGEIMPSQANEGMRSLPSTPSSEVTKRPAFGAVRSAAKLPGAGEVMNEHKLYEVLRDLQSTHDFRGQRKPMTVENMAATMHVSPKPSFALPYARGVVGHDRFVNMLSKSVGPQAGYIGAYPADPTATYYPDFTAMRVKVKHHMTWKIVVVLSRLYLVLICLRMSAVCRQ